MLLLRDEKTRVRHAELLTRHLAAVADVHAGRCDLAALHAAKLVTTLDAAARSPLYADALRDRRRDGDVLALFDTLPLLERGALRERSRDAFTCGLGDFMHYYESSGTTGDPVAAPKAVDDLVVNTVNIGELWGRVLLDTDRVVNLINGPFAPAGYQMEKVLEYLGVMSVRLWVDNVTGDYTRVLRLIDELSVNVYVGAPSRLLEMIHFAVRNNEPVPRFDRLLLLAEQTGRGFLTHLERLTGARAYVGSYGASETGTLAATCEQARLHLNVQSFLMELRDETGVRPVPARCADAGAPAPVDRGELVVTTLDLPARPLIRYCTGDLVEVDTAPCLCGMPTPVLRTLGRQQDVLAMTDGGVRQEDFEAALWSSELPDPTVLNYMLVLHGAEIICLVTTDREADELWQVRVERALGGLFDGHTFAVRQVDALPPLASMGSYVGWKLSRVIDLGTPGVWERLPAPIYSVLRQTLAGIEAATGLRPAA